MLRNVFVILLAAFGTASAFTGAFNGLLYYLWVAHFRPEAWVWSDFVQNLNLSLIAGLITLVAALLGRDRFRFNVRTVMLMAFGLHALVATSMSPYFEMGWPFFEDFAKSLVIVYLIQTLATDMPRLRKVFMAIALSLGFEGAKQGWAGLILNPGGENLNSVAHLGDNNAVAVGMLIVVGLMVGLASTATKRWERHMYQFLALGVLYRSVSTYSRGGMLATVAMGLWYLFRSRHKMFALASIFIACALLLPVLPSAFWERMNTVNEAREDIDTADGSILGRLHFWQVAMVMADQNPMLGVGSFGFNWAYDRYDFSGGTYGHERAVHSSWFGIFAELGYPGLLLYFAIFIAAFGACLKARAAVARGAPKELEHYALALEMGLVASAVGGIFVAMQYNELIWHVIGLTMALQLISVEALAEKKAEDPERVDLVTVSGMAIAPPWSHA